MTESDFMGNCYPCQIKICGLEFPSAENAFQAMRSPDPDIRASFRYMTPYRAAYAGPRMRRSIPGWNDVRDDIMRQILKTKFSDPDLKRSLLSSSGPIEITNMRHENYWGSCACARCHNTGQNRLGRMLEKLRSELAADKQKPETKKTRTMVWHPV